MSADKGYPSGMRYWGLGVEFAGALAGFALAGYWIDRYFDTEPWGVLIGVMLGLVGGLYNLVRQSLQAVREARAEDEAAKGSGRSKERARDGD